MNIFAKFLPAFQFDNTNRSRDNSSILYEDNPISSLVLWLYDFLSM